MVLFFLSWVAPIEHAKPTHSPVRMSEQRFRPRALVPWDSKRVRRLAEYTIITEAIKTGTTTRIKLKQHFQRERDRVLSMRDQIPTAVGIYLVAHFDEVWASLIARGILVPA